MTKDAVTPSRSKSRSRQSSADKVWAVGLAGATCLGLVGTMGFRAAQEAVASTDVPDAPSAAAAYPQDKSDSSSVASARLTYEQLDQYARALEVERMRLDAYRQELLEASARLQNSADALSKAGATAPGGVSKKAKKIAQSARENPKSRPKPAAAPQVVKPQAQTRGS